MGHVRCQLDWASTWSATFTDGDPSALNNYVALQWARVEEGVLSCYALPPVSMERGTWAQGCGPRHGFQAGYQDGQHTQVTKFLFLKHLVDRYRPWAVPTV